MHNAFQGAYESLRLHLELNEEDEARLSALQHLEQPLSECRRALNKIEKRLKTVNFIEQHILRSLWDGGIKSACKDSTRQRIFLNSHCMQISSEFS
jgi:hypothetical protein